MARSDLEQAHQPSIELLPAVQPNTVLVKGAPDQLKIIQELKEHGLSVTVIDIDVYQLQLSNAKDSRESEHRLKLQAEAQRHKQDLERDRQRHQHRLESFSLAGEYFLKVGAFAVGFYLTTHDLVLAGNFLMGAVAYTFARDFVLKAWGKLP